MAFVLSAMLLPLLAVTASTNGAAPYTALHCVSKRTDASSSTSSSGSGGNAASVTYRIEPWGENSLRVRIGSDPTVELPQQALLPQPPKPVRRVAKESDDCAVTNGNLKATVSDGKIQFVEASTGDVLLAEKTHSVCSGGAACLSRMPGVHASVSPPGSIVFTSSAAERLYGLGEHRTGKLNNHGLSLDFMDAGVYDHHHAGDIIMPFYLSEVPGEKPTRYGFMWNMASFGSFNSSDTEIRWSSASTPVLDFWVTTAGGAPPESNNPFKAMLGQFADATGHPPPMPDFATGFWQCKNRYRSQHELLATAREYKRRGLPISTIVIDYLHWDHFGDFALNKKCWPDPAAMMRELDDLDIRAMISIWPFVQSGDVFGHDYNASGKSVNFDAMHAGNMLVQDAATGKQAPVFRAPFWEGSTINFTSATPSCPNWCPAGACDQATVESQVPGQGCNTSAYYPELFPNSEVPHNMYIMDPFNPKTRSYVFEQMKRNYMSYGIKTFWLDEAEPERHTQDISTRYGYHDGTDAQVGLAWSRAEQQMVYEGLHGSGIGDDDIFMLSRSFFIGGARYGAGAWSGDIQSSFDELHRQVRISQNVAVSGIYWWTTDIGGYTGGNAADPVFRSLLVRWFQFGALCPLFRLHGDRSPELIDDCGRTGSPNEVWHYGAEAYQSIVKVMQLRESLRPYVKQVMAEANRTGVPALRPLFLEFPNDAAGIAAQGENVAGTLMLGPDYLLSPVTEYNATSWKVYLPKLGGSDAPASEEAAMGVEEAAHWVHHYTNTSYRGGKVYTIDVSDLDSFPLFKRSDSRYA